MLTPCVLFYYSTYTTASNYFSPALSSPEIARESWLHLHQNRPDNSACLPPVLAASDPSPLGFCGEDLGVFDARGHVPREARMDVSAPWRNRQGHGSYVCPIIWLTNDGSRRHSV